jgi:hypothetical protein
MWNYFSDHRQYINVKLSTGVTNKTTSLVFDNSADGTNAKYTEGSNGKSVWFSPKTARYIKESTSGSNYYSTAANTANLRTEIEVYSVESPRFTVYTKPLGESTLGNYFNVTVVVMDRYGEFVNVSGELSYTLDSWDYSQDLSWKILNLTDTTILKLSEDGNLAIAGELYELTNSPPPGDTVAFKINDTLWLTKSGDLYVEGHVYKDSNIISLLGLFGLINIVSILPVTIILYIRKRRKRDGYA